MMQNLSASPYRGSGALTREQFLFYEMRATAKLMCSGLSEQEIYTKIAEENLFQYPTEKSIRSITKACISRLDALGDVDAVSIIANSPSDEAKMMCLYAMMKHSRLVWDFMVTVIGEKYRTQDFSFNRSDVNMFFMRLQEQDDYVAGWSDATIKKISSVLVSILIENEYLDNNRSKHLNPVLISTAFENVVRNNSDSIVLAAFNCLG